MTGTERGRAASGADTFATASREDFARLERETAGRGPEWIAALRRSALDRFSELGFPTTRAEAWRHTSVAPIAKAPLRLAPQGVPGGLDRDAALRLAFPTATGPRIVFVNGTFAPGLSSLAGLPEGARVESLAAALDANPEEVEPWLARFAYPARQAFVALNSAFLRDGAFVRIPRGAALDRPVQVVFLASPGEGPLATHPRTLVVVEDRCEATIVEGYAGLGGGLYLANAVTEIVVGAGAVVDHYKVQRDDATAFHTSATVAHIGRSSTYASHAISFGGRLVRNDVTAVLAGEGSECTLNGLYMAGGGQHVDNHTTIDHAKPHAASHELYKGILTGAARGVFNGRIIVRPDAQKTDAKQTNKNLLLSPDAMVDTKPELEIYADDVKCTHGATIGRLDENQVFYLRSRGVPEPEAKRLLTYAFAADIVGRVRPEALRAELQAEILERLPNGGRPARPAEIAGMGGAR